MPRSADVHTLGRLPLQTTLRIPPHLPERPDPPGLYSERRIAHGPLGGASGPWALTVSLRRSSQRVRSCRADGHRGTPARNAHTDAQGTRLL